MNRSILELLGILFLIFVIMSEPPEKKFKTEAVAKAHQIIRNSVVVPAIPISSESTAVGVSERAGYYLTANGRWRKIPTPRSTAPVVSAIVQTQIVLPPVVVLSVVVPPIVVPPIVGLDPAVEARRQSVMAGLLKSSWCSR